MAIPRTWSKPDWSWFFPISLWDKLQPIKILCRTNLVVYTDDSSTGGSYGLRMITFSFNWSRRTVHFCTMLIDKTCESVVAWKWNEMFYPDWTCHQVLTPVLEFQFLIDWRCSNITHQQFWKEIRTWWQTVVRWCISPNKANSEICTSIFRYTVHILTPDDLKAHILIQIMIYCILASKHIFERRPYFLIKIWL